MVGGGNECNEGALYGSDTWGVDAVKVWEDVAGEESDESGVGCGPGSSEGISGNIEA